MARSSSIGAMVVVTVETPLRLVLGLILVIISQYPTVDVPEPVRLTVVGAAGGGGNWHRFGAEQCRLVGVSDAE